MGAEVDDQSGCTVRAKVREPCEFVATLEEVGRPRAADLLHQFALAAMPEIIRAHPKYSSSTLEFGWIADRAYEVARAMVDAGTRAEKELGQ